MTEWIVTVMFVGSTLLHWRTYVMLARADRRWDDLVVTADKLAKLMKQFQKERPCLLHGHLTQQPHRAPTPLEIEDIGDPV